jgi:hypothetical protein
LKKEEGSGSLTIYNGFGCKMAISNGTLSGSGSRTPHEEEKNPVSGGKRGPHFRPWSRKTGKITYLQLLIDFI